MKKLFLVSYDLNKPEQDYASLLPVLRKLGARKVLYSEWVLLSGNSAEELRDYLTQFVDNNDALLVVACGEWAGINLQTDPNALAA